MKTRNLRILSLLLTLVILLGCMAVRLPSADAAAAYENTYVNTGNQRADIIGVALTQVGYVEGSNNDTKYGTWYGLPYQPWCATFISWCARQAEISTDILARSGVASPSYFQISYKSGTSYTPRPGDLFFTPGNYHTGLVYYVEGEYFYTIEGNGSASGSYEGDRVIINKRKISKYTFGIPNYEGADGTHNYVRYQEQSHPHRYYYECSDCADKYYTGYTACVSSCASCLTCGCSASSAGYYLVSGSNLNIRSSHNASATQLGGVPEGAVVRVYGSSNGWAYAEYAGTRGHVQMKYLKRYYPAPEAPVITAQSADYVVGDSVTVSWKTDHAESYYLEVYQDGVQTAAQDMGTKTSYTIPSAEPGEYEFRVRGSNLTGTSQEGSLKLTVRDTYTVAYDPTGGSGTPASQKQVLGQTMTLSTTVPTRSGYVFLGWTSEHSGSFAEYKAGDSLLSGQDITLYAVWRSESAALTELTIARMPDRKQFALGTALSTSGLELKAAYSDGSGEMITDGFTVEGFDSEELGVKTITISYETMAVSYQVEIVEQIAGDVNLDGFTNRDDVMRLLWHISFPEQFPVEAQVDFTGDGNVDRDDVMQLLWHINFPEKFPLT